MATADELLAGAMTEVEQVLTINWETRTIDIPKKLTNLGVEYDDDTKHLKFKAPRYYHGTDLSEFRVAVGYWNANEEPDVHYPKDIVVDDSTLTFTWVVGPHAYIKRGNVEFLVYMLTTNAEGATEQRVGTTSHFLPVLKGGDPSQTVGEYHYDAITSAVLAGLQMAQNTDLKGEPGYTPVKGKDYFTEDERNEFAELIVRDHNGVFANALKGTVSGEVIRVDDVSPIEHTVRARVRGKNLVPLGYKTSHQDVARNEDGSVQFTSDGVLTEYHEMRIINIGDKTLYLEPGTYAFNLIGAPIGAHFVIGGGCASYMERQYGTLVVEQGGYIDYIIVRFAKGYAYDCTVYPMLVKGDVIPTEYEPYIDPASVTVTACGKNLLPYPFTDKTVIRKGVTFTDNGDGTITLNGTAEATTSFVLFNGEMPVNGIYTMSGLTGGSGSTYYIQPVCSDKAHPGLTDGSITYEWYGLTLNRLQLSVVVGTTFSNVKVKPMFELGDAATSFEPYIAAEYTPAANGSVDIVSVSPTMTLMTDTPGLTIEAEYSKDINCLHAAEVEKEVAELDNRMDNVESELIEITNGIPLRDRKTGKVYTVYVTDGKLMMD